eukprot:jgi/Chrzof1/5045/Cz15g09210.t1
MAGDVYGCTRTNSRVDTSRYAWRGEADTQTYGTASNFICSSTAVGNAGQPCHLNCQLSFQTNMNAGF